jgi:hypothetical protein
MIDWFDTQGNILNDMIGDPNKNNVAWAYDEIYRQPEGYAEGGLVQDGLRSALGAAKDTFNKGGKEPGLLYNSPAYYAQQFTNMGKFFSGPDLSTSNKMNTTARDPKAELKSENPNDYYARWYMGMRRFAEAAEVANRGQVTVRPR